MSNVKTRLPQQPNDFYWTPEEPFVNTPPQTIDSTKIAVAVARDVILAVNRHVPMRKDKLWSPKAAHELQMGNCVAMASLSHMALAQQGIASGVCFDGGHFWNRLGQGPTTTFFDSYYGWVQSPDMCVVVDIPDGGRAYVAGDTLQVHQQLELPAELVEPITYLDYERSIKSWQPKALAIDDAVVAATSDKLHQTIDELYIPGPTVPMFFDSFMCDRTS